MEKFICEYGCENEALFVLKNGKHCCSKRSNSCPAVRRRNGEKLKEAYEKGRRKSGSLVYASLDEETKKRMSWNRGLTKENNESVKSYSEKLKGRLGHFKDKKHSIETKQKISLKRIEYLTTHSSYCEWFSIFNGERVIKVQGVWEKAVAEKLNELKIKWDRKSITFCQFRRYTPDFYLPDYNVYLEVKGWMRENDKYKMWKVLQENKIEILLIEDLNILKEFKVESLEKFSAKYPFNSIDMTKFINYWN